ncbi:carbohydrate ABC transporter permease [Paenibacillus sp. 1P07SE]|uniref:carbohydrate ABC transporter permease n=1 Tax=Paenibacillus sp. 1P07SE TaxID=3132209 RepID=UPI0039A78176
MKATFDIYQWIIGLILLLISITMLYPFIYMLAVSLSSDYHVMRGDVTIWPKGWTLKSYRLVLEDSRIFTAYLNTFIYVSLGTVIALVTTAMGAYALGKRGMVMHKPLTLMVIFTMLFNGGMIPTFLVVQELGLIDTIWAMVLPGAVSVWNLIIMRTFFANIPKELEESGKIDGLNEIGIFTKIVLPLSKPALATIGLFYAVALWNNFYMALLYLRTESMFPLQVILRNIVLAGEFDGGGVGGDEVIVEESLKYATILVSTLPILLLYPFLQKYFVKGAMIGSVKG